MARRSVLSACGNTGFSRGSIVEQQKVAQQNQKPRTTFVVRGFLDSGGKGVIPHRFRMIPSKSINPLPSKGFTVSRFRSDPLRIA